MNSARVVVDADWSYYLLWSLDNHMVIVLLDLLISLGSPASICQGGVEVKSLAIRLVVFKPSEVIKHSTPLSDQGVSRKDKLYSTVSDNSCSLWVTDSKIERDKLSHWANCLQRIRFTPCIKSICFLLKPARTMCMQHWDQAGCPDLSVDPCRFMQTAIGCVFFACMLFFINK